MLSEAMKLSEVSKTVAGGGVVQRVHKRLSKSSSMAYTDLTGQASFIRAWIAVP